MAYRLDAVDDLMRSYDFSQDFVKLSKSVPDVEVSYTYYSRRLKLSAD
jgi:hypothetical protein